MPADLAQFVFQGEIGRGAMAIVWRGWDSRLERVVAVKEPLIPAGTSAEHVSEMASRFVVEGKVAARLSHPGLVGIYDAGVWDGRAAIIMEYVEGETLSNVIDRAPMPTSTVLVVLDLLLDAVGYAHASGVIHRDIKPDNVFVTPDGRIKLSDFGVARMNGGRRLTQAGTVVGTPGYMAPEQILGGSVDARADLFAIGVMAYEMLLGSNPFGATDGVPPTDIMRRVVHDDPPPLYGRLDGISAGLQQALDTALAKDPDQRFACAGDMAAAFRACAGDQAGPAEVRFWGAATGMADPLPVHPGREEPAADARMEPAALAGVESAPGNLRIAAGLEPQHGGGDGRRYWLIGGSVAAVLLAFVFFAAGAAVLGLGIIVVAGVLLAVLSMRKERESGAAPGAGSVDAWFGDRGVIATVQCSVTGPGDSRAVTVNLPARIGRAADAEVPVLDDRASRYHARLFASAGRLWVEDLESSNGTYLDGLPVNGQETVSAGQRLSVGMTTVDILGELAVQ